MRDQPLDNPGAAAGGPGLPAGIFRVTAPSCLDHNETCRAWVTPFLDTPRRLDGMTFVREASQSFRTGITTFLFCEWPSFLFPSTRDTAGL